MSTRFTDGEEFVPQFGAYYPESLVLGVLLGIVALLVTVPFLPALKQFELLTTGFFRLFQVQMALILWWVLSATVVESQPVGAALDWLAGRIPTTQRAIVGGTALFALVFGWINWALGLIGAVLIGQRLCRRAADEDVDVHYPLVLVGALLALITANQGITSPAALLMADASGTTNFLSEDVGAVPLGSFVLDAANWLVVAVLVATLPPLLAFVAPDEDVTTIDEAELVVDGTIRETFAHYEVTTGEEAVPADRLEESTLLTATVVAIGAISIGWQWAAGEGFTMLGVLFALMMLGMLTQRRPLAFVERASDATRWVLHLAVPFLLYAGVYALFVESGLYAAVGDAVAATGVPTVVTYAAALALGVLVPDPGSLWVLLSPGVTETAASTADLLAAVMYGAGLSNLWLGFLFLGVLGVRGFDWRQFVRYAAGITAYVSAIVTAALLVA